jgi:hypothetical protein
MKRVSVAMVFLAITAMNLNAQSIIWNISGANPAQYKSISADELWDMFKNNQLTGDQRYKTVITDEAQLTALSLRELQVLANAGAGTQASSRYFYFTNLPEILKKGITGRKRLKFIFRKGSGLKI